MSQRHALGAAGGSAGVQDKGDVIGAGGHRRVLAVAVVREIHLQVVTRKGRLDEPRTGGHRGSRLGRLTRRDDQEAGACVLEIEAKLVLFVGGVERARDSDRGGGEEQDDGLSPVGINEGDAVAAPHARSAQSDHSLSHQLAQVPVGDDPRAWHDDRPLRGVAAVEDSGHCRLRHHS